MADESRSIRRRKGSMKEQLIPKTDDDDRRPLAVRSRRYDPRPDPAWFVAIEVTGVFVGIALIFATVYYLDHVSFHVYRAYAYFDHTEAKHKIAQSYYHGRGVEQNQSHAMHWYKKAADDGHPDAKFRLALGHLQGHHRLPKGEAHKLIHHAAAMGSRDAHHALNTICADRNCD